MKTSFSDKPRADTDLYIIAVDEGAGARKAKGPDKNADAAIKALLDANPDFKGAGGDFIEAVVPGFKPGRLALLGLGEAKGRDALAWEKIGGRLAGELVSMPVNDAFLDTSNIDFTGENAAYIASGATLRAYEFRQYQTKNKDRLLPDTFSVQVGAKAQAAAKKAYAPLGKAAEAVHWARDLVNEPANILYPESFARRVGAKLKKLGVKVSVLDEKALEKQGFNMMIAVGKASEYPPRLVKLEYKGKGAPKGAPVALVGKGVTFDTGGYSLKPNDAMQDMKSDMAGAAAVAGAMMTLAANKAPVHVVAVLALAENMISDEGYKPSDVFTSLSGQTIEITNTDAEGRLVLCDAMWHVQKAYKPRIVVDIATLTGAALVALGEEYAAVYANNEKLWSGLDAASSRTGDKVWRMPLDPVFDKAMNSSIADMKNASATRYGGSCTGAAFLGRFIQKGVHWAHIDMAPTMTRRSDAPLGPSGATGFGVRLLAEWVLKA